MYQLNLLLIYNTEEDRKLVSSFLTDNDYVVSGSLHDIKNLDTLHFYPDVAIILTEINGLLKTSLRIRRKFPSVQIVYSNCVPGTSIRHGLSVGELLQVLEKETLSKRLKLIHSLRQINNQSLVQAESKSYELVLPSDVKPTYKIIADLIIKYRNCQINDREQKQLDKWRKLNPDNQRLFENLTDDDFVMEKLKLFNNVDIDEEWEKVKKRQSS